MDRSDTALEVTRTLGGVKRCGLCVNLTRDWRIATQVPMHRTAGLGIVRQPRTDAHRAASRCIVPKSEPAVMR
jgi:hypothetical protein